MASPPFMGMTPFGRSVLSEGVRRCARQESNSTNAIDSRFDGRSPSATASTIPANSDSKTLQFHQGHSQVRELLERGFVYPKGKHRLDFEDFAQGKGRRESQTVGRDWPGHHIPK